MKKSILCLMMVCICFVVDAQTKNSKRKTRKTPINTVKAEESQEEKTFKKYSLYFGIIRNQFSVDSPEKWNGLYYNFVDETHYYTSQRLEKYDYQIKGVSALNLGINKNITLGKSFSLSYGLGMDLFTFTYDRTLNVKESRIISEYEVISEGTYTSEVIIETKVNPEINLESNSQNILSSNYSGPIEHRVIAITLPIMLRYEVIQNLYLSANASISTPIISRTIGEKYNFSTGRLFGVANEHDTNINRLLINTGLGAHYHFFNKYSVGLNYKYYLNSVFSPAASINSFFNYDYNDLGKVSLSSLEVRLGYHF